MLAVVIAHFDLRANPAHAQKAFEISATFSDAKKLETAEQKKKFYDLKRHLCNNTADGFFISCDMIDIDLDGRKEGLVFKVYGAIGFDAAGYHESKFHMIQGKANFGLTTLPEENPTLGDPAEEDVSLGSLGFKSGRLEAAVNGTDEFSVVKAVLVETRYGDLDRDGDIDVAIRLTNGAIYAFFNEIRR